MLHIWKVCIAIITWNVLHFLCSKDKDVVMNLILCISYLVNLLPVSIHIYILSHKCKWHDHWYLLVYLLYCLYLGRVVEGLSSRFSEGVGVSFACLCRKLQSAAHLVTTCGMFYNAWLILNIFIFVQNGATVAFSLLVGCKTVKVKSNKE
jgi:hypothetical protein